MDKLTVKDFLAHNSPCFSCGKEITFSVKSISFSPFTLPAPLNTLVSKDSVEIELKITYNDKLKIIINQLSNKITTDVASLTKYLEGHRLFLSSSCSSCFSMAESFYLDFNFQKGFICPVGISHEMLLIYDEQNLYQINSSFFTKKSFITIDRIDKSNNLSPIKLDLPLISISKFKTKENVLNKIKTLLLFT